MMRSVIVILIFAFALSNCGVKPQVQQPIIEKDQPVISGEAVYPLIGLNKKDTSILSLSYQFYQLENDNPTRGIDDLYKDSINRRIHDLVQTTTEFEKDISNDNLGDHFFRAQLDSFAQIYLIDEDENSILWSLELSIEIEDSFRDFVSLTFSGWSYTGGAHGNGFVTVHMINKGDGRLLTLNDFVIDIEELNAIAEPIFREANELEPNESLDDAGYWFPDNRFSVNNNFYFNNEMMVFYYNTYEIAPYSGGPSELEVPITKINHLLRRKI